MPTTDRELEQEIVRIADERIVLFSNRVLGHNPGEGRSPREALAQVYFWMDQEEKRQTRLGGFVWAVLAAMVAGLGSSVIWPVIVAHLR